MAADLETIMMRRSGAKGWLTRAVNNLDRALTEYNVGTGIDEAIIQEGLDELYLR
jgi:hypothetical protein